LYNAALEERIDAWRKAGKSISDDDQQNALLQIKAERPEFVELGSHALQQTLQRLDLAFQAFFRRVKAGQTPGLPCFKSAKRFSGFAYPDPAHRQRRGIARLHDRIGNLRLDVVPKTLSQRLHGCPQCGHPCSATATTHWRRSSTRVRLEQRAWRRDPISARATWQVQVLDPRNPHDSAVRRFVDGEFILTRCATSPVFQGVEG
jgi:putative transposase